jgi:hypothetical protein
MISTSKMKTLKTFVVIGPNKLTIKSEKKQKIHMGATRRNVQAQPKNENFPKKNYVS